MTSPYAHDPDCNTLHDGPDACPPPLKSFRNDHWIGVSGPSPMPTSPPELIDGLRCAGASVEEGRHWYRALGPGGSLWCETSNPREAAESVEGKDGYRLERLPCYIVRTPWEPWQPNPSTTTED